MNICYSLTPVDVARAGTMGSLPSSVPPAVAFASPGTRDRPVKRLSEEVTFLCHVQIGSSGGNR